MSEINFTALGGGNEIGASCYLLQLNKYNILVDAGIRVNKKGQEAIPDIKNLPDRIDLVLFTHAHMDHTGGLPLIYKEHPGAIYITTPPTKKLSEVLLRDCIKIMSYEMEKDENTIPLYTEELLEQALWKIDTQDFRTWFEPLKGIRVCFHPAGHILGAANILIHDSENDIKILFTGDLSIAHQRTVSGCSVPDFEKPDILIMESTYGGGKHPKRQEEETRLATTVGEIIKNKGTVLIPAFALGRAQEIIIILRDYILGKKIPPFPVYVDGLVRTISDLYTEFLDYLPERLQNYVRNSQQPVFWNEHPSSMAKIIKSDKGSRTEALLKPCCIISSSGMLTGGPSVWYAKQLVDNPKNAILITGYQDEESPGRRLLELQTGSKIILNEEEFTVKCNVEKYHLSAHADEIQLCQWVSNIKPRAIILVHGDNHAIQSLRSKLTDKYVVWNPKNGERINPLKRPEWMTEKVKSVIEGKDIKYRGKIEITDNEILLKIDKNLEKDPLWQHYYSSYNEMEIKWHGTRLLLKGVNSE